MKYILSGRETVKFWMFLPKIQSKESVSMAVLWNNRFRYKYLFVFKQKMDIHDPIPTVKVVEKVDIMIEPNTLSVKTKPAGW